VAKTAYFDCFSGASGDMVLGALLDLGLPLEALRAALGSLDIEYGGVSAERVLRAGVSATRFRANAEERLAHAGQVPSAAHRDAESHGHHAHPPGSHVHAPETSHDLGHHHQHHHHPGGHEHAHEASHAHHSLKDIARYIERSALSRTGKDRALALFEKLAQAEAAIHEVPIDRIHLHEVGALDSIIDIVGAVFGMEWLGADDVIVSPLNVGSGTVWCAHGEFPVPAPATARLLAGVPIYAGAVANELVTPTGALLMTSYARSFGALPPMRVKQIGYGAGSRDFAKHPNVLRVLVGESASSEEAERVIVIECEIDDMNPQLFGPLMDRLYADGALDVFYAPVQMKKNRPGTLVTVVSPLDRREALSSVLFTDSTTIGVRYQEVLRERLAREMRTVETPVGAIRFKVASRDGRVLNAAPEFEDCAKAAAERGMSIKDVQALAQKAWLDAK
jgi:pyridinium-3,5-bisthiocarboxylic acid mononucleotide nickel chelatase